MNPTDTKRKEVKKAFGNKRSINGMFPSVLEKINHAQIKIVM